ncbi:hypothetical protein KDH_60390 [Dictyobacter sp. S3.2.2.5]|uniref:Glycosyltransferase RgtA/B/C/D-like domain-containing protein n=1 Tax=Dictyobacter halimunensis TaxID=3026934 RepID=A0ABQ6FZZ7_9CHLR|nr:hypothetical protein KDH_60390 [Dictyobacter sp. S3.2.2.5]
MKNINPSRSAFAPFLIFCLACTVRVLYNVTVAKGYAPLFDAQNYRNIGLNMLYLHHYCPPNQQQTLGCLAGRAPLWPAIIAVLAWIFGPSTLYPRLFFCLVGSGTCTMLYFFARDLWGKRIALITGLLAAVYVGLFLYDGWLYTESLFTFLQLVFCYALFRFQCTQHYRWAVISGITIALASLTRPNGVALIVFVVVWAALLLWKHRFSRRQALTVTLVNGLLAVSLIAPWTIRNYEATHQFIPVAVGSGAVLSGSYNDTALHPNAKNDTSWMPANSPMKQSMWINLQDRGLWVSTTQTKPLLDLEHHSDTDAYRTSRAVDWIRHHLSSMPYLLSLHFVNTWIPYTSENGLPMVQFPTRISSIIVWDMLWYIYPIILLLATLGLIMTWKRWKQELLVVYLCLLLTVGLNIALYGSSRFRAPIEPFLILLTGGCIWWCKHHLLTSWRFRPGPLSQSAHSLRDEQEEIHKSEINL